jgi:hypothetical protein
MSGYNLSSLLEQSAREFPDRADAAPQRRRMRPIPVPPGRTTHPVGRGGAGDGDRGGFVPRLIGITRKKALQGMWVTGSTAGRRCTGAMLPTSSGWRLRRVMREPGTTRPPKRAYRFGTSQASSADA